VKKPKLVAGIRIRNSMDEGSALGAAFKAAYLTGESFAPGIAQLLG